MREVIRGDFILSYWLFLWWILYELGIVKANPKLFLILGLLANLSTLVYKLIKRSRTAIPLVVSMTIIKIIPLMFLYNTTITTKDVEASVIVVVLYIWWVIIHFEKVQGYFTNRAIPPFEHWWKENLE
jgi:hypothetical protein